MNNCKGLLRGNCWDNKQLIHGMENELLPKGHAVRKWESVSSSQPPSCYPVSALPLNIYLHLSAYFIQLLPASPHY